MRLLRLVLIATMAVMVTGCSTGLEPTPSPTASNAPMSPAAGPTPTLSEAEIGYLTNVRHSPDWANLSDEDLLSKGRDVCRAFDGGATYDEAIDPLIATGSVDSAMVLASTAVFEFCDEHDAIIEVALGGPANPQADPTGAAADGYLSAVRVDPYFDDATDDAITMLGTTMCDGFTRGDTLEVTLGYMEAMPQDSAMTLLRAATTYICPQHASIVAGG